MPTKPAKPCATPGCPNKCGARRLCPSCEAKRMRRLNDARPSDSKRGYNSEWHRIRAAQLAAHPMCQCTDPECVCLGRCAAPAVLVHHVDRLVDTRSHLGPLRSNCQSCHSSTTVRKDGGFGKPKA